MFCNRAERVDRVEGEGEDFSRRERKERKGLFKVG